MNDPLVSFCLPTFNRAEYLAEAIDSIINQTYENWELVIVDDGSTDSTTTLLDYYTKKDKRIHYFSTKNHGIAMARNTAVGLSRGAYIAVMDSDDLCSPDRLKRQVKELQKGFDVCYSSYLRADENGTVIDGVTAPKPKELTKEHLLQDQGIPHVTVTAKRECFIKYPYKPEHTTNDDYLMVAKWVKVGLKMVVITDPLMIVRFHETNTSRVSWEEIKKINEQVRQEIRDTF